MLLYVTVVVLMGIWYVIPLFLRATIAKKPKCLSKRKLVGMNAIVTGCNTGMGKVVAAELAKKGAKVYMACRDTMKAEIAKAEILSQCPDLNLVVMTLDLASLRSVQMFAEEFLKKENQLDLLICNAGFGSFQHKRTEDNIEWHLATNHLGHFYLMRLLMPLLNKSGSEDMKSRIVVLSSEAHEILVRKIDYEGLMRGDFLAKGLAYGYSKLANVLNTRYMSKLLANKNVTINAIHPGTCKTDFFRNYLPFPSIVSFILGVVFFPISYLCRSPEEGAQTIIYAAVDEDLEGVSGQYLVDCKISKPAKHALDDVEAEKLWRWSCSKTKLALEL